MRRDGGQAVMSLGFSLTETQCCGASPYLAMGEVRAASEAEP